MALQEIRIPDLGGAADVTVVEILVKAGQEVQLDDSLIAVETDKATSEVPSSHAGKIAELKVKEGDKVNTGDLIALVEIGANSADEAPAASAPSPAASTSIDVVVPEGVSDASIVELMVEAGQAVKTDESIAAVETDKATAEVPAPQDGVISEWLIAVGAKVSSGDVIARMSIAAETSSAPSPAPAASTSSQRVEVRVPEGVSDASVVELMAELGSSIQSDGSLLAIETDKATAEVPSPQDGKILEFKVAVGDKVSSGDLVAVLEVQGSATPASPAVQPSSRAPSTASAQASPSAPAQTSLPSNQQKLGTVLHASPSVRQLARELGVDLSLISKASGPKGRITFADVKSFVKDALKSGPTGSAGIPKIDVPDFSSFGEVEEKPLNGIKKATGSHLSKAWLNIPMVTHFEEANISGMEDFRKQLNSRKGEFPKATPLAFITKAVIKALQEFPQVNSSLSADGASLFYKKYYNIGIAVDTPRGLLVPVIKNANQLSIDQLSAAISELGAKGRSSKLGPADMEGGSFTISSLGGLGGTNFTPLVNAPEAAILGVAKSSIQPLWNGSSFEPQLILPFSVSYDHRILDGGEVARFASKIKLYLEDMRHILV